MNAALGAETLLSRVVKEGSEHHSLAPWISWVLTSLLKSQAPSGRSALSSSCSHCIIPALTAWLHGREKESGAPWDLFHPELPPGFQYGATSPGKHTPGEEAQTLGCGVLVSCLLICFYIENIWLKILHGFPRCTIDQNALLSLA